MYTDYPTFFWAFALATGALVGVYLLWPAVRRLRRKPPPYNYYDDYPGIYGLYVDETDRFIFSHLRQWQGETRNTSDFVVSKGHLTLDHPHSVSISPWNSPIPSKELGAVKIWDRLRRVVEKPTEDHIVLSAAIRALSRALPAVHYPNTRQNCAIIVPYDLSPSQRLWIAELIRKEAGFTNVIPVDVHNCIRDPGRRCQGSYGLDDYPSLVFNSDGSSFLVSHAPTSYPCSQRRFGDRPPSTDPLSIINDSPLLEEIVTINYHALAMQIYRHKMTEAVKQCLPPIQAIDIEALPARAAIIAGRQVDLSRFIPWYIHCNRVPVFVELRGSQASDPGVPSSITISPAMSFMDAHHKVGKAVTLQTIPGQTKAAIEFHGIFQQPRSISNTTKEGTDTPLWSPMDPNPKDSCIASLELDGLLPEGNGEVLVWYDGKRTQVLDKGTRRRVWKEINYPKPP